MVPNYLKSGQVDVNDLDNAGNILKTALSLVDNHEYGESKVVFMPVPPVVNNGLIDLYGNESDYLIKVLQPVLATAVTTSCNLPLCPSSVSTYKSYGIALGANIKDSTLNSSLQEWLYPLATQCNRKFASRPPVDIPCQSNITLHCDGVIHNLCRGTVLV